MAFALAIARFWVVGLSFWAVATPFCFGGSGIFWGGGAEIGSAGLAFWAASVTFIWRWFCLVVTPFFVLMVSFVHCVQRHGNLFDGGIFFSMVVVWQHCLFESSGTWVSFIVWVPFSLGSSAICLEAAAAAAAFGQHDLWCSCSEIVCPVVTALSWWQCPATYLSSGCVFWVVSS